VAITNREGGFLRYSISLLLISSNVFAALAAPEIPVHSSFHLQTATAMQRTYRRGDVEVLLQTMALPDESAAKKRAAVEAANILSLYKPRTNPYEGQVSDLIKCDAKLMPKVEAVKVLGQTANLIVAGVSQRKLFGACNRDQIKYWAGYVQVYQGAQKRALELRIFIPAAFQQTPDGVAANLRRIAGEFFAKN
jgi:hypothetical protein